MMISTKEHNLRNAIFFTIKTVALILVICFAIEIPIQVIGKVAAANIDEFLGFRHEISVDVVLPDPKINSVVQRGRVTLDERESGERRKDFDAIEHDMTTMQARLESSRCLHCDYFGFGNFRGGRETKW